MKLLLAGLSLLILTAQVPLPSASQIILYKNAQDPIVGSATAGWRDVGAAYSATTFWMPFDQLRAAGARVNQATLLIVWQTRSPYAFTGAGMFACPGMGSAETADLSKLCPIWWYFAGNDQQLAPVPAGCSFSPANPSGPHPCLTDMTAQINALIMAGVPYFLTMGAYGNGGNGPAIYDVELQLSWATLPVPASRRFR